MENNFTLFRPWAHVHLNRHFRLVRGAGILLLLWMVFSGNRAIAQTGLIQDDFSTGDTYNWAPVTAGSSGGIVNGQFVVNMGGPSANGTYRADFQRKGGVSFHAGTYPIVAVKFNKPPRCNMFFDTNLGSYNGVNNNQTKIETPGGNVYYWDLSAGKLGSTTLSKTGPTTLSLFQLKVADIVLTQEELANNDKQYEVDWVKTFGSVAELRAAVNPGDSPALYEFTGTFSHPGLLHSQADLDRMKGQVAQQFGRAFKSYQLLAANNKASAAYSMSGPYTYLTRDNSISVDGVNGGTVKNHVESDFMAAYYNALMWNITGNEAHAKKSVEILDAYSAQTLAIRGSDAELNGLYGFMLANAAELMRSTYAAWPADKVLQCQDMLKRVFYPTLQNFRPCAHGNWDIICMKALMAIAVFTEDKPMFSKVVNYFYQGEGNGSIDNYVLTEAGQLQESNRDQPHTMLAIGSLAELSEMALKQGLDLYAASNNAILRGFEYTAKYNLGYQVPYQTSFDYCEKNYQDYTPEAISTVGRGAWRAVFEIAYNHYVFRKGQQMPFTLEALAKTGPEGAPFGADNPGYGSLFFYLNPEPEYQFDGGTEPQDPAVGLVDDQFTTGVDGWRAATTGSAATAEEGHLKITIVTPPGGKGRGDMQKHNTTLQPGNYPILAIKMKKPAAVNLTLDTNLGAYGNGANKWTGKVGEDIYYYDLTKNFGADKFLPATMATTLSTFQWKVADITSGETSYTVDWVKTVKSVEDLLSFDPNTGRIDDNFTASTGGWSANTNGAIAAAQDGQLQVTLAQVNGKGRGDIKRTSGALLYPANYSIVAVKLKSPKVVNLTLDTNLGAFGNGSNKQTGKVGDHIYYFDLGQTGFGSANALLSDPTHLSLFQFKVADITSGEAGYLVDWVKTLKSVAELNSFINPQYQDILFSPIAAKQVGEADFTPASATSGMPVSYSSSNPAVAEVVDGKVRITGAGIAKITAVQQGDQASFYPAEPITQTLTVTKQNQAIVFPALGERSLGEADFEPGASATSGLAITYSSSDEAVARIINGKIQLVGIGSVTITATQSGNYRYHAAESASQLLNVTDTTAPTAPEALTTIKQEEHQVALSWQPSADNVGVRGYHVYRNGDKIGTTTNTGLLTDRPIGNDMYVFMVKAFDAAGNLSTASQEVVVTNRHALGNAESESQTEALVIFPNPTQGEFNIRLTSDQMGPVTIILRDVNGAVISQITAVKNSIQFLQGLSLQGQRKGLYFLTITVGDFASANSIMLE